MQTKYASAERSEIKEIMQHFNSISDVEYIDKIINSFPYLAAILNEHRQIVYANSKLLEMAGLTSDKKLLGLRPGESLHCERSGKEIGGCGTSENCKHCGAVNTILQSQQTGQPASGECRINSVIDNQNVSFEFHVTSSPLKIKDKVFYIYSMLDISNEKRRRILEKIFFHDLLNKAGNIKSLLDLIGTVEDCGKMNELAGLINTVSNELLDEIVAQRQLSYAENDELEINPVIISTFSTVSDIAKQIMHNNVAIEKTVCVDEQTVEMMISVDSVLLKRILLNMLKNALEASPRQSAITIGCVVEGNDLKFWVHNPIEMPKHVKLQVFMRSFSTKGLDRGLGTYSMKLLGEKYLKGKVDFISTAKDGTIFWLKLPLDKVMAE